ncbi:MAG: hypothetical protein QM747_03480 [Nocardioides sp.]
MSSTPRTAGRHAVVTVVIALVGALTLAGCGSSSSSAASDLPTKKIHITINGSETVPNGTNIDVKVNQPIEFDVTADKPGEIHVHSSPEEQEFEYPKGTSTFKVKPISAPGVTTVESHTLDKTLFKLVAQ